MTDPADPGDGAVLPAPVLGVLVRLLPLWLAWLLVVVLGRLVCRLAQRIPPVVRLVRHLRVGDGRWGVAVRSMLDGPGSPLCQGGQMARINDVGGVEGFPLPEQEIDEPPFHADWEAHVFAMNRALIGGGVYDLDEFRDAIERMPAADYLASSYYEKWFHAITTLCVEKGILTQEQVHGG